MWELLLPLASVGKRAIRSRWPGERRRRVYLVAHMPSEVVVRRGYGRPALKLSLPEASPGDHLGPLLGHTPSSAEMWPGGSGRARRGQSVHERGNRERTPAERNW